MPPSASPRTCHTCRVGLYCTNLSSDFGVFTFLPREFHNNMNITLKLSTQHIRLRSPHWILRRIYSSPTSIRSSRGYLQENVATISAVGFAGLRRRTHSTCPIVCLAHLGALQFKRHRARACRRTRTLRSQAFFVDSLDFFRCRGVLEVRPIPYKPRNPSANSASI